MTPTLGQIWHHKNGTIRKVTEIKSDSGSWHPIYWKRMDTLPGPIFGSCSHKTWDRWAKDAETPLNPTP